MLLTIGYERSTVDDFVATLQTVGAETLVDIRDRAQSRRPGFSKSKLQLFLSNAGIEYLHLRELGDPAEGRIAARAGDTAKFAAIFGIVLQKDEAIAALHTIARLTETKRVCLMCYERDHRTCHRALVAEKLQTEFGIKATHIGTRLGASYESSIR